MASANEKLKMDFATSRNWTISDAFKIECCDTNNCNNQNVTAPPSPKAIQPVVVSSTAPSPTMTPTGPPNPTANANRPYQWNTGIRNDHHRCVFVVLRSTVVA